MTSSIIERALARRIEKGEVLDDDDLLKWYGFHPELRPEGWLHSSEVRFDESLIPEVDTDRERSEEELELDRILEGIDILDAFERWGKPQSGGIKVGSKRESIMVRCPDPQHVDNNPSAFINLDKQVYNCAKCEYGGDKFDVAAFAKGYAVPGYKTDGSFPKLKREMAEDFGWSFSRTPGGATIATAPTPVEPPVESDAADDATITSIPEIDDDSLVPELPILAIDWENLLPEESFMRSFMEVCTVDDLPHEYYFWLACLAVATAVGHNVYLNDFKKIKPNLYVCIYGGTGSGKSRSTDPFLSVVHEALPWNGDEYTESKGTLILPSPASSEALLHTFVHEILDGTNKFYKLGQIRGLLRVEEFASFVAKTARPGNPLKETLIELYDVFDRDVTHKSMGGGTMRAHAPFTQMLTTTQPRAIHTFMRRADAESGFMNRWIFAVGKARRARISYGGVTRDLTGPIALLKDLHLWADAPRGMDLQGDALKVWDEFYHREIGPLLDHTEESMLSRIDLHLKKLILIFTADRKLDQPTAEVVETVIQLFPYLMQTLSMFSTDVAYDEDQEIQQRVMTLIEAYTKASGHGPTRRDLIRKIGKKYTFAQIERALRVLELLGLIDLKKHQGKRGPETLRYVINA